MMYEVDVKETRRLRIEVEADDPKAALEAAAGEYMGGAICLGANSGAYVVAEGTCGQETAQLGSWSA